MCSFSNLGEFETILGRARGVGIRRGGGNLAIKDLNLCKLVEGIWICYKIDHVRSYGHPPGSFPQLICQRHCPEVPIYTSQRHILPRAPNNCWSPTARLLCHILSPRVCHRTCSSRLADEYRQGLAGYWRCCVESPVHCILRHQ